MRGSSQRLVSGTPMLGISMLGISMLRLSMLRISMLGISMLGLGCGDDDGQGPVDGLTPPAQGGSIPVTDDCGTPVGQAYFVSPTGDDGGPGIETLPWRTLSQAAGAAQPGDAVYLLEGTYDEPLVVQSSGTAQAPLLFAGAPGNLGAAVLDGALMEDPGEGLVRIEGQHHVKVCRLTIREAPEHGVLVESGWDAPAEHITLAELTVEQVGVAAILFEDVTDVVIERNQTRESVSSGIGVWYSARVAVRDNVVVNARNNDDRGYNEWISIAGVQDFEVAGNELYMEDAGFRGHSAIDVKESSFRGSVHHNYIHDFPEGGQIYLDAWEAGRDGSYNLAFVDVYANLLVRARGITVGSEQGGVVEQVRIFNNVIWQSSGSPIEISDTGDGGGGLRRDLEIFNNTLVGCRNHGLSGIHVVTPRVRRITIRNNLVVLEPEWVVGLITAAHASVLPELTVDHNLVSGPTECSNDFPHCEEVSGWPENLTGDPRFVNAEQGDFHLAAESTALDAGADVPWLTDDYDGVARPQGQGVDIGAFERGP